MTVIDAFSVGETVVYPSHGAVTVTGFETRIVRGEPVEFAVLESDGGLTVRVPVTKLVDVGARPGASSAEVDQVMRIVGGPAGDFPDVWARRTKETAARLESGSIIQIAYVVRDLGRRDKAGELPSQAERTQFRRAVALLADDIAIGYGIETGDAVARIDAALTDEPMPSDVYTVMVGADVSAPAAGDSAPYG